MPVAATKPVLWELADVVEQIFTIAFTENLYPSTEPLRRPSRYAAEHRLSRTRLESAMRGSLLAMWEVEEIACRLRLLQFYDRTKVNSDCRVVAPALPQPIIGATIYHNYRYLLTF